MILLTTSRRPTKRIRTFCHDFVLSVPNIIRINRGKLNLDGITEKAVELNANRIVVIARAHLETPKIKTTSGKAVYLLLCASKIPLRFSQIQEILGLGKATTYRALIECKKHNLIMKKKRTEHIRTENGPAHLTTVGWWPKGRKTNIEKLFNVQKELTGHIKKQL